MFGLLPRVHQDQLADIPGTAMSMAAQACVTCKKQKRKCDKLLPACSRCASLQRTCDYLEGVPAAAVPTAEDFAALQMKLAEIEGRLDSRPEAQSFTPPSGSDAYAGSSESNLGDQANAPGWTNKFPSTLFLDVDVYKTANSIPPKPEACLTVDVLDVLSSSEVIQDAVSTYFNTIHKWFSFISRKRMNLGISLVGGGPDLALLLLAIKLITTTPPPQPRSAGKLPLYWTTKQLLCRLEAAGTTSILYLQSQILIALYEYSHAIYPSAYMSVGACVRYADFLGLPSYAEASAVLGPCTTWTEAEERRRTWWAVHILDRLISLGSKRPFAGSPTAPPPTEFLPTDDDAAWDAGDMARSLQRPLSTPVDEPTNSPFARLAQAAVLVSKAMAHCRRAVGRWHSHHAGRQPGGGAAPTAGKSSSSSSSSSRGNNDDAATETDNGVDGNEDDEDDDTRRHPPVNIREVTALIKELDALCRACQADMARAAGGATGSAAGSDAYFGFVTARCVTWSAAVMVLDLYSCPEHMRPGGVLGITATGGGVENGGGAPISPARSEAELALQVEAINGLRTAALHVRDEAKVLLGLVEDLSGAAAMREESNSHLNWTSVSFRGEVVDTRGPPAEVNEDMVARISPFCLDVIYCGMSTFGWLWRENGDPEMKEGLEITRRCLERIGTRWRLAGEYLEVGKKQDGLMMEVMGLNGVG